MEFEKKYLTDLVNGKVKGELPPFASGQWEEVDSYLKRVVGRLKDIKAISVVADFDHYGSGFSSYVPLNLSKRDQSDVEITEKGAERTEKTNGLILYLCRLAPIAIYGEGTWWNTFKMEKWQSGSASFLTSEVIETTPVTDWSAALVQINAILNQFGIRTLTQATVNQKLDFKINIPTILSDPPYKVFDCFFYWED
ncbi:MAG: hypothetical protein AB8G15_19230 [Saprospiraceae bacterium]